jgi:hypothetical protein
VDDVGVYKDVVNTTIEKVGIGTSTTTTTTSTTSTSSNKNIR